MMPRSMSIYLKDELVKRIESFPEVNISEVMRRGLVDYLERREREQFAIEEVRQLREKVDQLASSNILRADVLTSFVKTNVADLTRRIEELEKIVEDS